MISKTQNEIVACVVPTHRISAGEFTHQYDGREVNHRSPRVGVSPHEAPRWDVKAAVGRLRGLR